MTYQLFLFDLDGVLLDSRAQMEHAWEAVRNVHKIDVPFETYFANIGRPFKDIMDQILLHREVGWMDLWRTYDMAARSRPDLVKFYHGAPEALRAMETRARLGVVTSKDYDRAIQSLGQYYSCFVTIQTPDRLFGRGKPAPDKLLAAMAEAGVDPAETIYIGDMGVDREAADRAQIDYGHAAWGYGQFTGGRRIDELVDILAL